MRMLRGLEKDCKKPALDAVRVHETRNSVKYRIMEHTIQATELARKLGDVLSRVRYRRDSFVIKRNGKPVARVVPVEPDADEATLGEALAAWCDGASSDRAFADDLDAINASDKPPTDRWAS